MPQMPPRIARLEKDARGYPIPWNVLRREGSNEPVFTVSDDRRHHRALREELCPLCGERLGAWKWFSGGPRSAFDPNGWYLDLPGHRECIEFALATCPYMANEKYLKRIDVPDPTGIPTPVLLDESPSLNDRPEVFVAVAGRRIEVAPRSRLVFPYVRPVRPILAWQAWRHGQRLGRDEAIERVRAAIGPQWTPPCEPEG